MLVGFSSVPIHKSGVNVDIAPWLIQLGGDGGRVTTLDIGISSLLLPPPPLQPYRNAVKLHLESPFSYISFKAKPFPIYFTDNQTCTSILRAVATSTTKVYLSTSVCLLPFDEEKWKRKNNGGYGALLGEMEYFGGMTEQKQNTK